MYNIPGVADFKLWFDRDFPFSTAGVNASAVVTANISGQIVQIVPGDLGQGYTSVPTVTIVDANDGPGAGAAATASVSNQQVTGYSITAPGAGYLNPVAKIVGGGVDPTNMDYVRDSDITRALTTAGINFNQALWSSQDDFSVVYLLRAAHFLCLNIRASTQGLRGRGGEWLQTAFAIGDINGSFNIPEKVQKSPLLAPMMQTTYGCQYLELLAPKIVANVFAACGHTKP